MLREKPVFTPDYNRKDFLRSSITGGTVMGSSRLGSRDGTGTGFRSHESCASPVSDQLDGVTKLPGLSEP